MIKLSDAIVVALISLAGIIITSAVQNKVLRGDFEKHSELQDAAIDKAISVYAAKTDERIEELTREVREHYNFARRVPVLEEKIGAMEKRVDALVK